MHPEKKDIWAAIDPNTKISPGEFKARDDFFRKQGPSTATVKEMLKKSLEAKNSNNYLPGSSSLRKEARGSLAETPPLEARVARPETEPLLIGGPPPPEPEDTGPEFIRPTTYTRISSEYGWRTHPVRGGRHLHGGTDMAAPRGTPVLAAHEGEIITASDHHQFNGNYIVIRRDDGLETWYLHLDEPVSHLRGQRVNQGERIGGVGNTGTSTRNSSGEGGYHLDFRVRRNGEFIDPRTVVDLD
ncbi:M23 family metallopeptidase [Deltaproteobacteria bacterium OttesenSCG-928-M10]|nr:M23 family metallopeptidase [Deltaproteobacteria bacterium OttesenSCG-928-M10]